MCFQLLLPLVSAGLSAAGSIMQQKEARKQAERQAQARNDEMNKTLAANDVLAKDARDIYQQVEDKAQPAQQEQRQAEATQDRTETLQNAVSDAPKSAPLAGSTPQVVQSEIAKRMSDTVAEGKASAQRLGKVGGYGSALFNQGLENNSAGRDIGIKSGFAAQNLSLLPYKQDFAEYKAYKPQSPLGGILMGLGGALGSYAGGNSGGVPKTNYISPY